MHSKRGFLLFFGKVLVSSFGLVGPVMGWTAFYDKEPVDPSIDRDWAQIYRCVDQGWRHVVPSVAEIKFLFMSCVVAGGGIPGRALTYIYPGRIHISCFNAPAHLSPP